MKVVFNADDLGYTHGVNQGIIDGFEHGVIRSTTMLMSSPYIGEAKHMVESHPGLGVGVHLNLTLGMSLTHGKTISDEHGMFYPGRKTIWTHEDIDYHEIYEEWKAQIEKYIEVFGHKPTHLDSHHSVHDANPKAYEISSGLAKEYGLTMRRYGPYQFVMGFFGDDEHCSVSWLIHLLEENKDKDIEIMVHPAWCDRELYDQSSYSLGRVKELSTLCSQQLKDYIQAQGIELVHY